MQKDANVFGLIGQDDKHIWRNKRAYAVLSCRGKLHDIIST